MNTLTRTLTFLVLLAAPVLSTTSAAAAEGFSARSHPVRTVGGYVERGIPRIQVIAKLGQPAERWTPDIWVYRAAGALHDTGANASCRTLIIRFERGVVAEMTLANDPAARQIAAEVRGASMRREVASHASETRVER